MKNALDDLLSMVGDDESPKQSRSPRPKPRRERPVDIGGRTSSSKQWFKNLKWQPPKLDSKSYWRTSIGLALMSIGLQLTPFGMLQMTGEMIGWVTLFWIAFGVIKNAKRNWPNATSVLLTVSLGLCLGIAVILFFVGSAIYVDFAKGLNVQQPPIDFEYLGASYAAEYGVLGRIAASFLKLLAQNLMSLQMTMFGLLGFLLFIIVTATEVAPAVLESSPIIMRNVVKSMGSFKLIDLKGSESAEARRLIDKHNNYFNDFLKWMKIARWWAYVVDLCVIVYSVVAQVETPWEEIWFTLGPDTIAWMTILRVFILLGLFEITIRIAVNIWKAYRLSAGKPV